MATVTPTLTLVSTDLLTDELNFSATTSITASDTSGLKRSTLTSISKTNRLTILDGDDAYADVTTLEGVYIDITDNHGLKIRYVFADSAAGGVDNDGTVIVAGTDLGTNLASAIGPHIYGGRVVQITNGDTQAGILVKLIVVINSSAAHNGSITAATISATTAGPQSTTMTNPTTGEGATFLIDAANSNWVHVDNTASATATNSATDHPILVEKSKFDSPAFAYINNPSTYHAANNRVFVYYDNHGAEDVMEIRGGAFAFIPLNPQNNLRAYTSTSGTVVESMVFGIES